MAQPRAEGVKFPRRDEREPAAQPSLPSFVAVPFFTIGAQARQTLVGTPGAPGYMSTQHRLSLRSVAANGTLLQSSLSSAPAGARSGLTSSVLLSRTLRDAPSGRPLGTVTAMATSQGGLDLDASWQVVPGLRTSFTSSLLHAGAPSSSASSARAAATGVPVLGPLGFEATNGLVHAKGSVTPEARPVINLALGTGVGKQVQLGADLSFSVAQAVRCAKDAREEALRLGRAEPAQPTGSGAAAPLSGAASSSVVRAAAAMHSAALVGGLTRWSLVLGYTPDEKSQVTVSLSDDGLVPARLVAKLTCSGEIADGVALATETAWPLPGTLLGASVASVGVAARVRSLLEAAGHQLSELRQGAGEGGKLVNSGIESVDRAAGRALDSLQATLLDAPDGSGSTVSPDAFVKLKLECRPKTPIATFLFSDRLVLGGGKGGAGAGAAGPSLRVSATAQVNLQDPFRELPRVGFALDVA